MRNVPADADRLFASFTPRTRAQPTQATHCREGHELTEENTQWNTGSQVVAGERIRVRTRLCKICSRARQKRYYATTPRTYQPVPPRPEDPYEGDVERIVRRAIAPPMAKQMERLVAALDPWPIGSVIPIPARDGEDFPTYKARTRIDPWQYTWWLASRVLADRRIDAVVKKIMASESNIGGQHDNTSGTAGTGGDSRRL
jgi:hypothetical protein